MEEYRPIVKELIRRLLFAPTRVDESLGIVPDQAFARIMRENVQASVSARLPLCQDTGIVTFYVGHRRLSDDQLDGLRKMFEYEFSAYARPSERVPLIDSFHLGTNQLVYMEEIRGRQGLGAIVSGAGTEMHAYLKVYAGTEDFQNIVRDLVEWVKTRGALACPPIHISVAIGGTAAEATREAKIGFLFGDSYPSSFETLVAALRDSLRGVPVDPKGGTQSWLGKVFVRLLPAHISAVPVALSMMCWPFRAEWMDVEIG